MRLKLRSGKFKYKDVNWTAHLVFFYTRLLIFVHSIFSVINLINSNTLHLKCILYQNFNSFNCRIWVAVGVVVVHVGLSVASDYAMVRKVKVTNGVQELRTEEDSLELRQVGSW